MRLETKHWNNPVRLRSHLYNYAKLVVSLTAINGFYALSKKSWFIFGINGLFFLMGLITIMSKSKFDRLPPQNE